MIARRGYLRVRVVEIQSALLQIGLLEAVRTSIDIDLRLLLGVPPFIHLLEPKLALVKHVVIQGILCDRHLVHLDSHRLECFLVVILLFKGLQMMAHGAH